MISIIIPTSSHISGLRETISSVLRFIESNFLLEVLVIVNGSSALHAAENLSEHFWLRHPKIRVIQEPVGSLLAGRHRGIAESSGDILCFVDDDVSLSESWLRGVVEAFSDPRLVLAGGPSIGSFDSPPPRWLRHLEFEGSVQGIVVPFLSLLNLGEERICPVDPNLIWGLNFCIRRKTVLDLGGFHPDGFPSSNNIFRGDGETGLTRKIANEGLTAGYFPQMRVIHRISSSRLTKDYVWDRGFNEGISSEYTHLRHLSSSAQGPGFRRASMFRDLLRKVLDFVVRRVPHSLAKLWLPLLLRKSHLAGKDFLRHHYRKSAKLREWISRDDYWDYLHPDYL